MHQIFGLHPGFRPAHAKGLMLTGTFKPELGNNYLTDEQVSRLSENYHFDEIAKRIAKGPVRFRIVVQIADAADTVDNATVHWPESREKAELGTIELTQVEPDTLVQQKHIIFDPIPRVDGIEPSADPLLELRAAIYLLSGRQSVTHVSGRSHDSGPQFYS